MNDGGALLTREEMWAKLREMAPTSAIAAQGLALKNIAQADGEETALMIAIAALTALEETQRQLLQALQRPARTVYFDRRNIIDEG